LIAGHVPPRTEQKPKAEMTKNMMFIAHRKPRVKKKERIHKEEALEDEQSRKEKLASAAEAAEKLRSGE